MLRLVWALKWPLMATVAALAAAGAYGGAGAVGVVALLIGLELSISFDNAVVNAGVLRHLSETWQRLFLTVGILIAVFGMRLVFPIAIVAVAVGGGLTEIAEQAFTDQAAYAAKIEAAKPIIGGFGGGFLLMVALGFLLDPDREVHWLGPLERPLAAAGRVDGLPAAITAAAIVLTSQLVSAQAERDVLLAGITGLVVQVLVHGLATILGGLSSGGAGAAGLGGFLYLEMLDASFSLDGVIGAFALTTDIVIIALGLGVGALYIRSLTVILVRRRTLRQYPYLRNGAHWAIAALAAILLVSTEGHVPEWITGAIGLGVIAAAFASSIRHNRRCADEQAST
ncbi:MAG TPA: DUF475 domain-containing protein [Solirubrobacteraceae bacterium]|nr:DUF475 domain-containing protein [Solirubrobacteraceae bacterium]